MRRVLVLGAGFGGLELSSLLAAAGDGAFEVTLIDRADAFVFGYAKLDVLFGRATLADARLPYRALTKPGVRLVQAEVTAIDAAARSVTTDAGEFDADVLVVALGADYDVAATPGLATAGDEFYSVAGAERLSGKLPGFTRGRAVVGICGAPYKCPPAPSEAALLLHDDLVARGVRDDCEICIVSPFEIPIPPSPETSAALLAAFAERGITFAGEQRITSLDGDRSVAVCADGSEFPFDLFLGVPKHRAPDVVVASGLTEDGFVPVDPRTLATRVPGVYAVGDVATIGVPKAGVFAEGAARVVARALIADVRGEDPPPAYDGRGSCYVEFGAGRVARIDIDFLSGPEKTTVFHDPSPALVAEKREFGTSRRERWFES